MPDEIFQRMLESISKEKLDGRLGLWLEDECYRFYVKQRRIHCDLTQLIDLWLRAPRCMECQESDPFFRGALPDICPDGWETDLLIMTGGKLLKQVKKLLRNNPEYAFLCRKCQRELRPWDGDEVYIETFHLEEHFGLPMETPGKKQPSKKLRQKIFELYDFKCFGCNRKRRALHIDHINPRTLGGDSAFRNLQPLCDKCGQKKGHTPPTEVSVYSNMYFEPNPSDAFEGLFW